MAWYTAPPIERVVYIRENNTIAIVMSTVSIFMVLNSLIVVVFMVLILVVPSWSTYYITVKSPRLFYIL